MHIKNDINYKGVFPFVKMRPGDSFEVIDDTVTIEKLANRMQNTVNYFMRNIATDWKLITRRTEKGVRVFRVK